MENHAVWWRYIDVSKEPTAYVIRVGQDTLTLVMEADPSEMSQHTYQTTMHHTPHDTYQQRHWDENLKSSLHLLLHGNIHTPLTSAYSSRATYYSTPIIMFHRPQPTRTTTGKSCDDKLEHVQSRLPCVIRCSLVVCTPDVAPMC
jgi:hypothetical protein